MVDRQTIALSVILRGNARRCPGVSENGNPTVCELHDGGRNRTDNKDRQEHSSDRSTGEIVWMHPYTVNMPFTKPMIYYVLTFGDNHRRATLRATVLCYHFSDKPLIVNPELQLKPPHIDFNRVKKN